MCYDFLIRNKELGGSDLSFLFVCCSIVTCSSQLTSYLGKLTLLLLSLFLVPFSAKSLIKIKGLKPITLIYFLCKETMYKNKIVLSKLPCFFDLLCFLFLIHWLEKILLFMFEFIIFCI